MSSTTETKQLPSSSSCSVVEEIQTTPSATIASNKAAEAAKCVEKCTLIIVDDDEEESEANIFIVPQDEVTERMRQLFAKTFYLKDVKNLKDCEHQEFEQILVKLSKYKVPYESNPSGPPQLIVERIRARY